MSEVAESPWQFRRWFERTRPMYGQTTIWILLVIALTLAALPPVFHAGPRADRMATLIGWMPESLLRAEWFHHTARALLALSAIAWGLQRALPWSAWLTAASFSLVWALRMENVSNGAHIFHMSAMLLWIHAAWMHAVQREWRDARIAGTWKTTELYPRWVFLLVVFQLGLFHTWAGVFKMASSGLDWGNGLSLQLWVHLFGWEPSPFGKLVLADRTVAMLLQSGAMIIEALSFLCWFGPRWRILIGVGLLGFYSGVLGTFVDYGFHFNCFLVAWFLLPVEPWFRHRS